MLQPLNPKDAAVLIVEDSPADTEIAGRALERFGIRRIFAVGTGEEALQFLAQRHCDVVLVDHALPGMNGLELLERIQTSWPDVRVLVVTGCRDERVAASAMKLGAADYVAKDELLTSGIIRSLQAALRDKIASAEEQRRVSMSSAAPGLEVAREEAKWLLETFAAWPAAPEARGEQTSQMLEDFVRYLEDAFRTFPEPSREEESLVRLLVLRGLSPSQVLAIYRASLSALLARGAQPPIDPALCLVRVFALMVAQYQVRQSYAALERRAA